MPNDEFILGYSLQDFGVLASLGITLVGMLCSLLGWLIEWKRRKKETVTAREVEGKLKQEINVRNKRISGIVRENERITQRLNDLEENYGPHARKMIDAYINALEKEKDKLEKEKAIIEARLNKLNNDLDRMYQEHKLSAQDIPGAENEAELYRKQLNTIISKLDSMRSSIITARSVSEKFANGEFNEKNVEPVDDYIEKMRKERERAGGNVAYVKGAKLRAAREVRQATVGKTQTKVEEKRQQTLRKKADN